MILAAVFGNYTKRPDTLPQVVLKFRFSHARKGSPARKVGTYELFAVNPSYQTTSRYAGDASEAAAFTRASAASMRPDRSRR